VFQISVGKIDGTICIVLGLLEDVGYFETPWGMGDSKIFSYSQKPLLQKLCGGFYPPRVIGLG